MLSTFSCTCWSFVCLHWKNIYSDPFSFSNWIVWGFLLLSCISSLQTLNIIPLLDIRFANIFSHSVGCLFILLLLWLCRSFLVKCSPTCLFLFLFLVLLVSYPPKSLPRPMSGSFLPGFYSRSFMISGPFKSLIHFEL